MSGYFDGCEPMTLHNERRIGRARKPHRCSQCDGTITVGESYWRHFWVFDGDAESNAQCLACRAISDAFEAEHHVVAVPCGMTDIIRDCIDESRREHDDDAVARWTRALDEMAARRADSA